MHTIYRIEPDGTETVVACVDDQIEIGIVIEHHRVRDGKTCKGEDSK